MVLVERQNHGRSKMPLPYRIPFSTGLGALLTFALAATVCAYKGAIVTCPEVCPNHFSYNSTMVDFGVVISQALRNAAVRRCAMQIGPGVFPITNTIRVPSHVCVVGAGTERTRLTAISDSNETIMGGMIELQGAINSSLSSMTLDGTNCTNSALCSNLLKVNNSSNIEITTFATYGAKDDGSKFAYLGFLLDSYFIFTQSWFLTAQM